MPRSSSSSPKLTHAETEELTGVLSWVTDLLAIAGIVGLIAVAVTAVA